MLQVSGHGRNMLMGHEGGGPAECTPRAQRLLGGGQRIRHSRVGVAAGGYKPYGVRGIAT